jgi:hypothetical protein
VNIGSSVNCEVALKPFLAHSSSRLNQSQRFRMPIVQGWRRSHHHGMHVLAVLFCYLPNSAEVIIQDRLPNVFRLFLRLVDSDFIEGAVYADW